MTSKDQLPRSMVTESPQCNIFVIRVVEGKLAQQNKYLHEDAVDKVREAGRVESEGKVNELCAEFVECGWRDLVERALHLQQQSLSVVCIGVALPPILRNLQLVALIRHKYRNRECMDQNVQAQWHTTTCRAWLCGRLPPRSVHSSQMRRIDLRTREKRKEGEELAQSLRLAALRGSWYSTFLVGLRRLICR